MELLNIYETQLTYNAQIELNKQEALQNGYI